MKFGGLKSLIILSPTLRLPNMDFYPQKNTEQLQVSRFAGFYLSRVHLPDRLLLLLCAPDSYTSNIDFYSGPEKFNTTNALPVLANCTPSMALICYPQKMVARWTILASSSRPLPCFQCNVNIENMGVAWGRG